MKKKMKIYYLFNNKFEKVPMIKISNKMLEKFGFRVGDEVEIEYANDKITIKKQDLG